MSEKQPAYAAPRFREYSQPRYWAGWLGYKLIRAFRFIPQPMVWALGAALGELGYWLHKGRTIKINLALCFPEMDEAGRRALRRRYYHFIGRSFLGLGFAWAGCARHYDRLVHVKGREHLDAARAQGRGVLFLAPHFLPLEAGGIWISAHYDFIGLYRKPRNPMLHQALRHAMGHLGGQVVERYDSLKWVIKAVRKGAVLYYLPDQDPDRADADYVFAPFFGVPTATYTAFGRLARAMDAAVVPVRTRMLPWGRGYELEFLPELQDFPVGEDMLDATRLNQVIETMIRECPEQYLWSYRRFKTRPEHEPPIYV